MLSVGFIYFIFLYVDIRHHIKKAKHAVKEKERRIKLYEEQIEKVEVFWYFSKVVITRNLKYIIQTG